VSAVLQSVRVPRLDTMPEKLGFFRFGNVDGKRVVTNDAGEWVLLTEEHFRDFIGGSVTHGHEMYEPLRDRGFLRDDLDVEQLATKVRRKKRFLGQGPHLHIVITTLRCNQGCVYCHASRTGMDHVETDMPLDIAKGVVDLAMQSPSPYINFEFTGGEPTINMPAIQLVIEYSREKNRYEQKSIDYSIVTNMTNMDEEKAEYLLKNDVWVCTSLDGPAPLHDWNRAWMNGHSAFDSVIKWVKYFNRRYIEMGRDRELYHVDALMTTTRKTFDHWKELVDLYVELGMRNIFIRPLNPFGFATKTWKTIGYTVDEYHAFYRKVFDYIIELNLRGVQVMEGTAALILKKMLTPDDPNFVDLRSPVGSGLGQIAYCYDGRIYPSDEGRMVAGMKDDFFLLGEVGKTSYEELALHPTTRTLAASSLLDALPQCSTCWNAPYCGVRPEHNYMGFGDFFAQRPLTPKCHEHMALSRLLLERIDSDRDGRIEKIFRRWTIDRPRQPETAT
jgi:His-Xaa-Ser system radical SAM maturase HxsB